MGSVEILHFVQNDRCELEMSFRGWTGVLGVSRRGEKFFAPTW